MVASTLRRAGLVAGLSATLALAGGAPALARSGWDPAASMSAAHRAYSAAMLPDGDPLVISGFTASDEVPVSERYDTATGTWSEIAPVLVPRHYASATRLLDGRILLAGGFTDSGATTHAELYDPVANTWTATGALATPRNGHSAVLLRDGRVLVIGGSDTARNASATGEVYDPVTGTWTVTANGMSVGVENLNAALLPDGRVLAAGGFHSNPSLAFRAGADVYDPTTNSWSPTGSMATARGQAGVETLPDGRVIVAAGVNRTGFVHEVEIYDPATGTWSPGGRLPHFGNIATAAALDDGRILFQTDGSVTTSLYDPASGEFSTAYATSTTRVLASPVVLEDGRVLLAGGGSLASAELFTPPTERTAVAPDFGDVTVGSAPVERDVTVENAGGNRLWIDGTALAGADAGDFEIVSDACARAELPPAGRCVVRVRFTPSAEGARTAQLTFDDNAESSPAAVLSGAGEVRAPPREDPRDPPARDPPPVDPPPAGPPPGPPADPGKPRPTPPRAGRAIERFALASNCVRPTRAGIVRIDLRLRLGELRPIELRVMRGVGTGAMKRCPPRDPSRRFAGRLQGVGTVDRLQPTAVVSTVSGRRTVRMRLKPGLYRLSVRVRTESGRLSAPAHRWLRVIAPR